ncbi:MAG: hypothetical protein QXR60_03365 [Candidatus Nanoarchaeia archaeon]
MHTKRGMRLLGILFILNPLALIVITHISNAKDISIENINDTTEVNNDDNINLTLYNYEDKFSVEESNDHESIEYPDIIPKNTDNQIDESTPKVAPQGFEPNDYKIGDVGICDEGDEDTSCNITTPKNFTTNQEFNFTELYIQPGGSIELTYGANLTLNASVIIMEDTANITAQVVNITAENITLNFGSVINVTGKGYQGGYWSNGSGPGGGIAMTGSGWYTASGAGYGGEGGYGLGVSGIMDGGMAYGSITEPTDLGSGGGGGGGRIAMYYNTNSFTGSVSVDPGMGYQAGEAGTVFQCYTISNVTCSGSEEDLYATSVGIRQTTHYSITQNISINRTIITDWHQDYVRWNESATNTTTIATYNITGLNASLSYFVYDNGVYQQRATTDDSGNLALFNITLSSEHEIIIISSTLPIIYLEMPEDNATNTTTNTIDFTYNVTDYDSDINNCSLIINDEANLTESSITVDAVNNLTTYLPNGDYLWSVNCTDENNNIGNSEVWNITIDYTAPVAANETEEMREFNIGAGLFIDLPKGPTLGLAEGDRGSFLVKGRDYTILLKQVTQDEVIFEIGPSNYIIVVKIGETQNVDIDKDGEEDFSITLHRIDMEYGMAHFSMKLIEKLPPPEKPKPPEIRPGTEQPLQKKDWRWAIIIIIIASLIFITLFLILITKKRRKKKQKRKK